MISVAQALSRMLPAFSPVGTERRMLLAAQDAHLAVSVNARRDLPAFDNSAMDGYALRHDALDTATDQHPVSLTLQGESRAGSQMPGSLAPAVTMRIFTGAPLPEGADAVELQENVERCGTQVLFRRPVSSWANVRRQASDLTAGHPLLQAKTRLGPAELALLASQDIATVEVFRSPRVAVLSSGDELREVGEANRPGSIVNTNAYALAAQIREAGASPWILPVARDRMEDLLERVAQGLQADVLLCTGGVSVGDHDLVRQAFSEAGVKQDFYKVAMKPGKPLAFGIHGNTPVVGLPGNPISAMVTFELFVRPGLRRMIGDPYPFRTRVLARLDHDHRHSPGRLEFARATLLRDARDGSPRLTMHARQGSGSLTSSVGANALAMLARGREHFPRGTAVACLLLRAEGSEHPPFEPDLPPS